jgi:superfamily II DNA or RNA helicase
MELREYQLRDIEKIRDAYRRGKRSPLYVGPTGSGKTTIFGYVGAGAAAKGNTVLIVVHRHELLMQAVRVFGEIGIASGLIKSGLPRSSHPLQIASAQTLTRRLDQWPRFDLVVFDEAHHLPSATFSRVYEHYRDALKLLVTATPQRLDGLGLGDYADELIIGPNITDLCDLGFLARSIVYAPVTIDVSHIHTRMGDFATSELADVMDRRVITGKAVEHYERLLNGQPAVCFCVTLDHCDHVVQQFEEAGWSAARIDGEMSSARRQELIDALADGLLNILTSCELLTEGIDCPPARGIIWLRPTKSLTLFLQGCGRAMRPKPDGAPMIVLDHVGNSLRLGLPDEIRKWSLDGRDRDEGAPKGPPRLKVCPRCDAIIPSRSGACPECAFEFPINRIPIETDGQLSHLQTDTFHQYRHQRQYALLDSRWRTSSNGNLINWHSGCRTTVFPSKFGGWSWVINHDDGETVFRSTRTQEEAKRAALLALIQVEATNE